MAGYRIDDEEKEYMLGLYEQSIKSGHGLMATYGFIARATKHSEATVARVMRSLMPTTKLATAKLRAGSSKLVDRLLAKAEVPDILDILSRPNIGVLAPVSKGGSDGPTGVFVSVQSESCGAVKVGVIQGGQHEVTGSQVIEQGGGQGGRVAGWGEGLRPAPSGEASELRVEQGDDEEDGTGGAERGYRGRAEIEGLQVVDGESQVESPQERPSPRSQRGVGTRKAKRVLDPELEKLRLSLGL